MDLRRKLLAIVLLMRVMAAAFGGANESKVVVDLRAHRAEIRQALLRYTPIGSKVSEVLKFVAAQLVPSGSALPKIENGPATGPAADGSHRRGVKTMRVYLGQYYDHPEVVFLTVPLIMRKEVTAQWAFDERNRLVDVFVDKETGVY